MIETDATIPLPDSSEAAGKSSGYENDTSESDWTSHTDSDEDYECSELEPTDDEEGLKNERISIVFESMLDQLFINCKTCGSICEIEKSNTGSMGWLSNTVKRTRVVQMVKLASRTVRTVRFVKIFTDRE